MIGLVAELAPDDARQLAIVDGRIEVLGVKEIAGDALGKGVRRTPGRARPGAAAPGR